MQGNQFEIERMKNTLKLKGINVNQGWGKGSHLRMIYEKMPNEFRLSLGEVMKLIQDSQGKEEFKLRLEEKRLERILCGWCR